MVQEANSTPGYSFYMNRPPYQVGKKRWVCQRLVCEKREFAARLSSCEVSRYVKFTDPTKFKHEIFVRIDSNYFIV